MTSRIMKIEDDVTPSGMPEVDNIFRDLHNFSQKADVNNCFLINSKYF